jgi:hypothetical protein
MNGNPPQTEKPTILPNPVPMPIGGNAPEKPLFLPVINRPLSANEEIILMGAVLLVVFFWFTHYPAFTDGDGMEYGMQAWLYAHGKVVETNPLLAYGLPVDPVSQTAFSRYPVGYSLLLIPFVLAGFKTLFLANLILHLLIFGVFYHVLKKLSLPPLYSLLYLFFPFAVFFTYTVESEMASIFFLLLGTYFVLHPPNPRLAGICLGLAAWMRFVNILFVIPFMWLLLRNPSATPSIAKRKNVFLSFAFPFIILLGIHVLFTWMSNGTIIPYQTSGEAGSFALTHFWENSIGYLLLFVIGNNSLVMPPYFDSPFIIPLTLVMAFVFRKKEFNTFFFLAVIPMVFVFSLYQFTPSTRFMFALVILSIIPFIYACEWAAGRFNFPRRILIGLIVLFFASSSLSLVGHYNFSLGLQSDISNHIYKQTPENSLIVTSTAAHHIFPTFGTRYIAGMGYEEFIQTLTGDRAYFTSTCLCSSVNFIDVIPVEGRWKVGIQSQEDAIRKRLDANTAFD